MHVHACMYECMHECRYICVYVGIYTCMYVSMYTHIVCKYVCMYVCTCNVVWSPTLERHADQRWIRQKADDDLGLMARVHVTPPRPPDRGSTSQEQLPLPTTCL